MEQVIAAESHICKDIKFISEEQVSAANWNAAFELVKDLDPKDVQYIAFAKQFNRKVWSGDKALIAGLEKKGFTNMLTTDKLHKLREEIKRQMKRLRK